MFNFKIFKKIEKIRISDLKEEIVFPQKGWFVIVCFFVLWLVFSSLISAYIFFKIMKEDVLVKKNDFPSGDQFIDISKLKEANDFIHSRKGE